MTVSVTKIATTENVTWKGETAFESAKSRNGSQRRAVRRHHSPRIHHFTIVDNFHDSLPRKKAPGLDRQNLHVTQDQKAARTSRWEGTCLGSFPSISLIMGYSTKSELNHRALYDHVVI